MPDTYAKGVRINYKELGEQEPVLLLLPAWCTDKAFFEPLLERGRLSHRAIALDWRGHGHSDPPQGDFGTEDLIEDALAVIDQACIGVGQIIPVALSHAGWVAIELRRRLGERISKLIFVDWLITPPTDKFMQALRDLCSEGQFQQTRDQLFQLWLQEEADTELGRSIRGRMDYNFDLWSRAAREVIRAYGQYDYPLKALTNLQPPCPCLHLYSQPQDAEYFELQRQFSGSYPWFVAQKLSGRTHFPTVELPEDTARVIEEFVSAPIGVEVPISAGGQEPVGAF